MPGAATLAKRLRPATREEVAADYAALKSRECQTASPLARTGLTALDNYFLKYRIKAKTKRGISFYEAIHDPEIDTYLAGKVDQLKQGKRKNTEDQVLRLKYDIFQLYYGTINQFRPTEAVKLYCALKPRIGVLDFSAGWGGRCLAAAALGIPYVGIDANTNLEQPYRAMLHDLEPGADITMIFKPSESVDFSRFKYDLVFTSPPYFMIEGYEKMPAYASKAAFLDVFFRPVVEKAWASLAVGGHLALNMPAEMYDAIRLCLPPLAGRVELALAGRHATNAAAGKRLGTSDPYKEYTYIWKKTGRSRKTVKCRALAQAKN
jgi:hypothetical protein